MTEILWYQWKVEPLGNGRCTINNVAAGSHLGWEMGNDGITQVVKTNLPKEWIVKSINLDGYTYSYVGLLYKMRLCIIQFSIGSLQATNRFTEQTISRSRITALQRYDLHCCYMVSRYDGVIYTALYEANKSMSMPS